MIMENVERRDKIGYEHVNAELESIMRQDLNKEPHRWAEGSLLLGIDISKFKRELKCSEL